MMDFSLLIEGLRQTKQITPLEQDILDTLNEIQKQPFDRDSAQRQILKNNVKYPEICDAIVMLETTVVRPFAQAMEGGYSLQFGKAV